MIRRVDIQSILRNPEKRRTLLAGVIRFMASHEGRDLSWKQALAIVDRRNP